MTLPKNENTGVSVFQNTAAPYFEIYGRASHDLYVDCVFSKQVRAVSVCVDAPSLPAHKIKLVQ